VVRGRQGGRSWGVGEAGREVMWQRAVDAGLHRTLVLQYQNLRIDFDIAIQNSTQPTPSNSQGKPFPPSSPTSELVASFLLTEGSQLPGSHTHKLCGGVTS